MAQEKAMLIKIVDGATSHLTFHYIEAIIISRRTWNLIGRDGSTLNKKLGYHVGGKRP